MRRKNTTLAMDVIRMAKNRERFWFLAFAVTLAVSVTRYFVERRR